MAKRYKVVPHQVGFSDLPRDASIKAKMPGRRRSKTGKVYYEYRANRSDIDPRIRL